MSTTNNKESGKKRQLSSVFSENEFIAESPPNKRIKLTQQHTDQNIDNEQEYEYDDNDENIDSDEYEVSDDYLFIALTESPLIKKLDIPDDILSIIDDMAEGDIIECWRCNKQDHVDDATNLQEELAENDEWEIDDDSDQLMCGDCCELHSCSECSKHMFSWNGCWECMYCYNIFCGECAPFDAKGDFDSGSCCCYGYKDFVYYLVPIADKLEYWQNHQNLDGGCNLLKSLRSQMNGDYNTLSDKQKEAVLKILTRLQDTLMIFFGEGTDQFQDFEQEFESIKFDWNVNFESIKTDWNNKGSLSDKQINSANECLRP